jgi:DNA-binding CsgD family transcriptional regulator
VPPSAKSGRSATATRSAPRGRAGDGDGIASLTHRAGLVVDRRTKPESAAELFLSQKIVERQMRNLFQKLGVATHVEVARAFKRSDR